MNSIKNIYNIASREFISYLKSPMFYVTLAAFFLLTGLLFFQNIEYFDVLCKRYSADRNILMLNLLDLNSSVLGQQQFMTYYVASIFLPLLTMKLVAEEKKNHTLELLMTSPITSLEIILGKYFSICMIWLIILFLSVIYLFIVSHLPHIQLDFGLYFSGMFGLFVVGLMCIAIGLFASTLIDIQLLAAFLAFIIITVIYYIGNIDLVSLLPFGNLLYDVSSFKRLAAFLKGTLDTGYIIYFVSLSAFFLLLSERVLESQRWR